jgi:hypothetical protein
MEAYVLIVETPFFAKTAADGRAVIGNVPAGRYRMQLWHPQQKALPAPSEIEVGNASAKLRLVLDVKPRERKPRTETDPDRY